jgi:hypothetical protein
MPTSRRPSYPPAPWHIVYFKRHRRDDPTEAVPGRDFLSQKSGKARANLLAAVKAVADGPPPAFSGGGRWETMTGSMAGYYQVKGDSYEAGGRWHHRLFCLLERDSSTGLPGPSIVVLTGMTKPYLTVFGQSDYDAVKRLGDEYKARVPRSFSG